MRIIINAYQYAPAITGTDRMASNFLRELQKIDNQNEYIIICSSVQYIQPVITAPNFKVMQPKHILKHPLAVRLINKLWRETLDVRLKPMRADVYFSFHNMRLPKKRIAKKMIASNLDLIPLVLDGYGQLTSNQIREIKDVSKLADKFMSISHFSKQELHEQLKVPLQKIEVIHLAADVSLSKPTDEIPDIPNNFIFTVGGSEPRKNVQTVAKAYASLPSELQEKYPLLIVGGEWHGKSLEPFKITPTIKTLGYVDDATLSYLYSHANAFIFASEYEGFGFTILEAMSAGSPVITATGTSLDEVAGDAAITFDPHSAKNLQEELRKLLEDKKLQNKFSKLGQERAKKFSWEKSAKKLHELLTH